MSVEAAAHDEGPEHGLHGRRGGIGGDRGGQFARVAAWVGGAPVGPAPDHRQGDPAPVDVGAGRPAQRHGGAARVRGLQRGDAPERGRRILAQAVEEIEAQARRRRKVVDLQRRPRRARRPSPPPRNRRGRPGCARRRIARRRSCRRVRSCRRSPRRRRRPWTRPASARPRPRSARRRSHDSGSGTRPRRLRGGRRGRSRIPSRACAGRRPRPQSPRARSRRGGARRAGARGTAPLHRPGWRRRQSARGGGRRARGTAHCAARCPRDSRRARRARACDRRRSPARMSSAGSTPAPCARGPREARWLHGLFPARCDSTKITASAMASAYQVNA